MSKLAGLLIKEAITLTENFLAALGVTAAASVIDAGFQKKIHGSRRPLSSAQWNPVLITSNKETNDIMKTVQALEDSDILLKGVTKIIKNQTKEHKGKFLSMLLGTLGASLLGNILAGKAGSGRRSLNSYKKGIGILRAGYVIFNAASSFNKLWNTKILSEWTKI